MRRPMQDNANVLNLLRETNALREGHFKLSSGRHSNAYLQCAQILQYPRYAQLLGSHLAAEFVDADIHVVISPALGGLIIGHEVASALQVKAIFTERVQSAMILRRGFHIDTNARCLIIEDVVTTGRSTGEVVSVVKKHGGIVAGIGAIADRSQIQLNLPVAPRSIVRLEIPSWEPDHCPLCRSGSPLESPGSRFS